MAKWQLEEEEEEKEQEAKGGGGIRQCTERERIINWIDAKCTDTHLIEAETQAWCKTLQGLLIRLSSAKSFRMLNQNDFQICIYVLM